MNQLKIPVPEARKLDGLAADLALRAYFDIDPRDRAHLLAGNLTLFKSYEEWIQARVRRAAERQKQ